MFRPPGGKGLEQLNAARMSAAGDGLTEPNLYLLPVGADVNESLPVCSKLLIYVLSNICALMGIRAYLFIESILGGNDRLAAERILLIPILNYDRLIMPD